MRSLDNIQRTYHTPRKERFIPPILSMANRSGPPHKKNEGFILHSRFSPKINVCFDVRRCQHIIYSTYYGPTPCILLCLPKICMPSARPHSNNLLREWTHSTLHPLSNMCMYPPPSYLQPPILFFTICFTCTLMRSLMKGVMDEDSQQAAP